MGSLKNHYPEYLMEAAGLALFMFAAAFFTALFEVFLGKWIGDPLVRRVFEGGAIGLTATALVYSPWGKQSGAHFNPVVTLTFWRLGKVHHADFVYYVLFQFIGGYLGILVFEILAYEPLKKIGYIATIPGEQGVGVALMGEALISFLLMLTILWATNTPRLARYTGILAGIWIALFIIFEAPFSGMSMNPARTVASALPSGQWAGIWLYFLAPALGMLLSVEVYRFFRKEKRVICAKLHHLNSKRCIFKGCGYAALFLACLQGHAGIFSRPFEKPLIDAVVSYGMTVEDMDRSVKFYTEVLTFRKQADFVLSGNEYAELFELQGARLRVVRLKLGQEVLNLMEFLEPKGRPIPQDFKSDDLMFQHIAIVVSDINAAYGRLLRHNVSGISVDPQKLPEWNPNAAGIQAYYFRDPDGHPLEIIEYPPGKGDDRWHQLKGPLFLGIDHSAIAVKNTSQSLEFYEKTLGLKIVGQSLNYGIEQEKLSGVKEAKVRITSLKAEKGPGIELLDYIFPISGREMPRDTRANDLWHWQICLNAPELSQAYEAMHSLQALLSRVISVRNSHLTYSQSFLVADPSGHQLLISN